uniref:Uncharacterized protein n=1 Tax=Anguilla anguilla TaxID=7936 RepID=A0A0E9WHF7_ANGAN
MYFDNGVYPITCACRIIAPTPHPRTKSIVCMNATLLHYQVTQ